MKELVTVIIDRPLGSYHPKYPDLAYPINYGYIKEMIGGDGEYQDAYVIGIDYPVEVFTGKVIAVVHRLNDVEDKLVVCEVGKEYKKEEILDFIYFQEKYFEIEIEIV